MPELEEFRYPLILITIALLFLAERRFPLRRPGKPLPHRLVVNGCMSLLTLATALTLVRPVTMSTLSWANAKGFGILSLFSFSAWVEGILGFLMLDLSFYYWHRLNHRISFLWRFHNVHHFDPDMDVSTGFRFHFVEVAFSAIFRALQMIAVGTTLPVLLLYEFLFQVITYFHHSNLRLYGRLDRVMNFLLVTPSMHGIHHSNFRNETNSNYSVVCSLWDRLHGTFRQGISQSDMIIGVPGYSLDKDNGFFAALLAPFLRQRDYWKGHHVRYKASENPPDSQTTNSGRRP